MLALETVIAGIEHLNPVSDVTTKVMTLFDDPDCGVSDLSDIIRHEAALTANVLKLANSAYFGLPGKIVDAKQAIVYLGMTQVVDLVLMASCASRFDGAHQGYGLDRGELWKSAVSGAIISQDLAHKKGLAQGSLIFTGALMRDIGKVVLNQHVRSSIEAVMDQVASEGITFREAERHILGIDHAQVGALVAKKWQFPPVLGCIIAHYHMPLEAPQDCFLEAAVVHLADAICRKMEIGLGVDDAFFPEDERVAQTLGLNDDDIQAVVDGFGAKMEHIRTLFDFA